MSAADPARQKVRNEDARREVLASTPSLAYIAATIHRRLAREHDFTLAEVIDAINFLTDAGFSAPVSNPLASTLAWKVTHKGTLHYEASF